MVKILLKPFFKKYLGLFISMVFISALSISLLSGFGSSIINLKNQFSSYLNDYEDVDCTVKTTLTKKEDLATILDETEGVESYDYRLTLDAKMRKSDGRIITARFFTFSDDNTLFHRYQLKSIPRVEGKVNVAVIRKFADNNNIQLGDSIEVGYFKTYVKLYVNEIIETPEGIQARANDYVWGDTSDFGYIYISEVELNQVLMDLSTAIKDKIENNPEYKEYYDKAVKLIGIDLPDLTDTVLIANDYAKKYANQILIKGKDGYSESQVAENVKTTFNVYNQKLKEVKEAHKSFYILYIENCIRQIRVASIFLPVFFYAVTMIIIGLFINQIIKSMTKEIGVMMSIGVGYRDINSIFLIYILIMSITACVLGILGGFGLSSLMGSIMIRIYSIPIISKGVNFYVALAACVAIIAFSEITTLIACKAITRITPKDATLNNESNRKPLPKWLAKFIEKAPMNIKLGTNSIAQNKRRFFVSIFSIVASFIIILLALFFNVSKKALVEQSINKRLNFDAQIYATTVLEDEDIDKLISQEFVTGYLDCYYTYVEIKGSKDSAYVECLAYDNSIKTDMVQIPDEKGNGIINIESEGIIIPKGIAKKLKIKAGDTIKINDQDIKVAAISNQYFHSIAYLSKAELTRITENYISSIIVNTVSDEILLSYLDDNLTATLTVFTSNLNKDISAIFTSINVMIYILIGFSLLMGFIILSIMSQNALMEQQRQLTVLRAIGFTIMNVSNFWTLQSVLQLVLAAIIAIPLGSVFAMTLFNLCSSASQTYPFIFSFGVVGFAFGFILIIIFLTHLIAMFSIKKWNIADNTRSRE